jgi:hypothetical protein
MEYSIPSYFLEILTQLIRIQNEQMLTIISENEDIKIDSIKHLIPSAYEIKMLINNLQKL